LKQLLKVIERENIIMKFLNNPQLQLAFDFVQYTDQNIFLTGKAGTGKTTFLLNLKGKLNKRMIVVAPTGVAAINAHGVTIHSFFQLPFGPHIPTEEGGKSAAEIRQDAYNQASTNKFNRDKINIIRSLDLLIIDEISMVRADVLDAIDEVLRRYKNRYKPFGGVQLLMIGDLQQLPPVVRNDDWEILRDYYTTMFFFGSKALQKTSHIPIELRHIYRQSDDRFISLLNKVRDNKIDEETLIALNKRFVPGFANDSDDGYITLTSHVVQAQKINETKLEKLPGKNHSYKAIVTGEFPEYSFPTDNELLLKIGAQVMFIKNDISHDKQFYNGKIGKVVGFEDDNILVQCPDEEYPIIVAPLEWNNYKYSIDEGTKEIKETSIGTFLQYPLKLAWAITIHKSQGLTFEKAIIDANAAFAHGQVYVALSRCKTLEGIVLNSLISPSSIKTDYTITAFTQEAEQNQPDEVKLETAKQAYQHTLVTELFDYNPIDRRMRALSNILSEHKASLHDSFRDTFYAMSDLLKSELVEVSFKFGNHIKPLLVQQANIEENQALQERIKKGCLYFHEKTNAIIYTVLQNTVLETDNKAVRKAISDAIEKLVQETNVKLLSLKACMEGFSMTTYLDARAKAVIEKPEIKREKRGAEEWVSNAIPNPKLYALLKKWRNNKAEENNIDQYMVIQQKTLVELVTKLPVTNHELKLVKGFGKVKTIQFGDEVLAIIKTYLFDHRADSTNVMHESEVPYASPSAEEILEEPKKKSAKAVKVEKERIISDSVSFELFNNGHSIAEIAKERGITVSTIETHLGKYVESGEIGIQNIISKEKIDLISEYYLNNQLSGIGQAKEALGDDISYSEIRFFLRHLAYLKKMASK
jgi:nucleoside-triphosphatase THEP1